jgi:hypothetical protein
MRAMPSNAISTKAIARRSSACTTVGMKYCPGEMAAAGASFPGKVGSFSALPVKNAGS